MNFIESSIFILFFAIISVPIATRFKLPLEIFLVVGSCLIGLLGVSAFQINPMIVFYIFLPPILFYAAYFTSWHDFRFNLRPISLLALGLVIFTMITVALIAKMILPLTWAEAFLLGSIVSPTDASAATAIIKKLGAPRRLITILEGESLVNDATALLLFRFSLTAVLVGSFSFGNAIAQFFVVTTIGALVGLLVGLAAVYLLKHLKDAQAETTLTFVTAFTCYMLAERMHVSGIIATVLCGIYFGIKFPEFTSSQTRISAKLSWNTLLFIVNCFVFTLIGLELPWIIKNLGSYTLSSLILYGLTISLIVILVRMIWVFLVAHLTRILIPSIARKDPTPPWQTLFILSWSGMRGIVSLAAALSLPYQLPSGEPFANRELIIFITYCVIVLTLILPTFSLPYLLQIFRLTDTGNKMKEEALARIRSLEGVLETTAALAEKEHISGEILIDFRKHIQRRLKVIETQLSETPYSTLTDDYISLKKLTITALQKERDTLIKLRRSGEIHDEVFHHLSDELDLEEIRTRSLRM